ncbi:MAG: hypothetical protein Q3999_03350 [Buchananella hordeovulneris]|nr:hypothetical protein [Buchananella hordeovulneris]
MATNTVQTAALASPAAPNLWKLVKANLKMGTSYIATIFVFSAANLALNLVLRSAMDVEPINPALLSFNLMAVVWAFMLVMGVLEHTLPSVDASSGASRTQQVKASWVADFLIIAGVVVFYYALRGLIALIYPGTTKEGFEPYIGQLHSLAVFLVFSVIALAAAGRLISLGFRTFHWVLGTVLIVPWLAIAALAALHFVPVYGAPSVAAYLHLPWWTAPLAAAGLVALSAVWGGRVKLTTL